MYGNVVVRRRIVLAALAMAGLGFASLPARAQGEPVKVGELNSYNRFAAFAVPYRNGMQLAQEEINAKGGVLGGRKLEIIFRDDGSAPGDAVRVAEELLTRENVAFLAGTFLSNVGLAVADFANQKKTLFIATEPLTDAITMGQGNRYTFRVRPSTYMQTKMLVEAVKAKGVKKWAIVAPNYEYGQSAAANFKKLIKAATPDAEIVGEQFPALGKIDAGATVAALENVKPDGIFNVLVRRGPDDLRARGQHPRPVREAHRGEPADRRARVPDPARRGDAGGLDRHRLSLGPDHGRPAQDLHRRLPRQVQRHAAARLVPGLLRRLPAARPPQQGRLHRHREADRHAARTSRSPRWRGQ